MSRSQKFLLAGAVAIIPLGAALPASAALTYNALTYNAISANALRANAIIANALTSNGTAANGATAQAAIGTGLANLNGVAVEDVTLSTGNPQ